VRAMHAPMCQSFEEFAAHGLPASSSVENEKREIRNGRR